MSEFEKLLESYQARVNQKLEVLLPDDDSILISAMRYSVLNGGKRLRPILAYLTGELNDTEAEYIDTLASSLELIHCYSLIHDDLPAMDDDELRRGIQPLIKNLMRQLRFLLGMLCNLLRLN